MMAGAECQMGHFLSNCANSPGQAERDSSAANTKPHDLYCENQNHERKYLQLNFTTLNSKATDDINKRDSHNKIF
jgi:hypothetical protein